MSVTGFAAGPAVPAKTQSLAEAAGRGLIWLTAFAGAFVLHEPAPYEFISIIAIVVLFAVGGLPIAGRTLPMIVLLSLFVVGGLFGALQSSRLSEAAMYMAVTTFLAGTSVLFASYVARNPDFGTRAIFAGYTFGAVIATTASVVGYFELVPGTDIFTRHNRASGTFEDPNVLAAFLLLPTAVALQRALIGDVRETLVASAVFVICAIGVFLTFSRGGWGLFPVVSLMVVVLTYALTPSLKIRARIVVLSVAVVFVLIGLAVAALSLPEIREVFEVRATLSQQYDIGPLGRFGRQEAGFFLVLDKPLGIGPLEFARLFPEDPHNVYLNAFLSYGWLGGVAYALLTALTLFRTARCTLEAGPYRWLLVPAFSSFFVIAVEGLVVDTDHWRHFFLLMGVCWGLVTAHERWRDGFCRATSGKSPI